MERHETDSTLRAGHTRNSSLHPQFRTLKNRQLGNHTFCRVLWYFLRKEAQLGSIVLSNVLAFDWALRSEASLSRLVNGNFRIFR